MPEPHRSIRWPMRSVALLALWAIACGDDPIEPAPEPPNRPPIVTAAIPARTIQVGEKTTIDLTAHFADPDGDTLAFGGATGDPAVATATVAGSTLTVEGAGRGTTDITVTARDPGGFTDSQSFDVSVPNQAPMLTDSIAALELFTSDSVTIDLSAHFRDPDGDALSFTVEISNPEVARSSLSGHVTTVTAVAPGTADLTITGRDPTALTIGQTLSVTVPNRQPAVAGAIRRQPVLPGESIAIDLLGHFRDPDGEALRFTALTSDGAVASASTSGRVVRVAGVGPGRAEITVIARDPGDLSIAQSFVAAVPANADRDALVALYEATDGPNWRERRNWLSRRPLRSWQGVATDGAGRVTGLRLGDNGLVGPIPPELGWLTELTDLYLPDNNLKGAIPPELGRLRALERLHLDDNSLTGAIPPELGRLRALEHLRLGGNSLTGAIPQELGDLAALIDLWLAGNALTGSIPPELGNLSKLESLLLYQNALTGSIPSELGRLHNLEWLGLRFNNLTGSIPPGLGGMKALERLTLDHNSLTGSLPRELGRLRNLRSLWLHDNILAGQVPDALGNLENLESLYLYRNSLTGPVPHSLLRLDSLEDVLIADNDGLCVPGVAAFVAWTEMHPGGPLCNEADRAVLTALFGSTGGSDWADSRGWPGEGLLDRWRGVDTDSAGRVLHLDLRNNGLAGHLPPDLGSLDHLAGLRIGANALTGPIPRSLAGLRLNEFDYAGTSLCVPSDESFKTWLEAIPVRRGSLDECPALSDRDILVGLYEATGGENWDNRENWLTDAPIESWHGVSVDGEGRVVGIRLLNNGLMGPLPPELGDLSRLRSLRLGSNSLSGSIPPQLGNLAELAFLSLAANNLTGAIPPQLASLASLEFLHLAVNELSGPIPPELGGLGKLRDLSLGSNRLSGSIPPELARLARLNFLGLGDNRLTGGIPTWLGDLTQLDQLDLAHNRLVGSIPPELGNLVHLERIYLARNQLFGPIPPELGTHLPV